MNFPKELTWKDFLKTEDYIPHAQWYEDLLVVAWIEFSTLDRPIIQICGPMSSGWEWSLEANRIAHRSKINLLKNLWLSVFDQMKFDPAIDRIWYSPEFLDVFYGIFFQHGFIQYLFFRKWWESSSWTRKEHELGKKHWLKLVLPDMWDNEITKILNMKKNSLKS